MDHSSLPKMVHDVLSEHTQAVSDRLESWLLSLDLRLQQAAEQAPDMAFSFMLFTSSCVSLKAS